MRKRFTAIELLLGCIIIPLSLVGIYGWVENIIKLCHMADAASHLGMLALRVVGIFMAPIGAVLGFIS